MHNNKDTSKSQFKKTSITVEPSTYDLFKRIAKENDSDASKEIRKFIKEYIARHEKRKEYVAI